MSRDPFVFRGEVQTLDAAARAAAPGRFVSLPDGMVHYQIAGPPEGQTVVLVPGFSVPFFIWDPTFEALAAAGFHVLRYDLFGRGYSDRPDTVYDQDLFDRQLDDLLAALGIVRPVDLVGLSMGGAISVVFADRHPESVRKLGLIDPAGLPWGPGVGARLLGAPGLGERVMNLLGDRVMKSNIKHYCHNEEELTAFTRKVSVQMAYVGFKRALLSTLRSGITTGAADSYQRVGRYGLPVLLLWGRDDRLVPFELNERVRELIPKAVFHPIEGAAHIPHWEQPEVVNPLLVAFLKRQ